MKYYEEVKVVELKTTSRGVVVTFEYESATQKPKGQIVIAKKIFEDEKVLLGDKMLIRWSF